MQRIVLAHPTDLTVMGAQAVIARTDHSEVVGTANSLERLWSIVAQTAFDVLVVHVELDPDTDVLQLVASFKVKFPYCHLILMGGLKHGLVMRDLLDSGVSAYLYEGDELQTGLVEALQAVRRQRLYLSPTANAEYLVAMQTTQRELHLDAESQAVLRMLAQGHHIGWIAYELKLQPRRVYWIREKLRNRFGAQTNEHLMSLAAAEGYRFP